ncbi:hypothetical protein Dvina_13360 [Dactylosporangium vinaceum]|uniref:Uncharacterized protein n=1 Tax=Dactylosporangium vinaceum TaxID=53362 RepID=A0ABV5MG88_9ACTN|nr:hypothetical protein [Dactylosporangium vinaceum]UAB98973.1 hypothetical protein Dvina_13360 [Dactylosporangium vinaceum]
MSLDDDWHYLPTRTRAGALQRGLGRGAVRAGQDPAAPELIQACIRRDHRWLPLDDRGVYLARLVRDLDLPVGPIVARLFTATDETGEFTHVLRVAEALARAGNATMVESLRRYVEIGHHWREALTTIATAWPANWWDDLLPAAADRLASSGRPLHLPPGPPWGDWATRDERIRAAVGHGPQPRRGLGELLSAADLYDDELADPAADAEPCLAAPAADSLSAARRAVADPASGGYWRGLCVIAEHGDESDGPALLAGLDWLDKRADDMCGYDRLVDGLVRVGGDAARQALPRIRSLWFSPHSYERAAYLRARLALEPDACAGALTEGLWDCEADVRLIAVRRVPLDAKLERRLEYLRDDPIEVPEVRAAAAERLTLESIYRVSPA